MGKNWVEADADVAEAIGLLRILCAGDVTVKALIKSIHILPSEMCSATFLSELALS